MIAFMPVKSQAQLILEDLAAENLELRCALTDSLNMHHRNLEDASRVFREDRGHVCESRKAIEAIRARSFSAIKRHSAAQEKDK